MTKRDQVTEEKIFEAASIEFEQKGMDGARMQDIADRAGINKALLHYYYRTKDKLLIAVFDKLAEKMFTKFSAVFELELPLEEKISYFFREHISFLEKNPRLPLFIIREIHRNPELLQRFMERVDLRRIKKEMTKGHDLDKSDKEMAHLMVSIISLSVFPVLARPIIEGILGREGIEYNEFLDERKEFSPWFTMCAIKVMNAYPMKPKDD